MCNLPTKLEPEKYFISCKCVTSNKKVDFIYTGTAAEADSSPGGQWDEGLGLLPASRGN